jgi:hypothetical protein
VLAAGTEGGKLVLRDVQTGLVRRQWQLPGVVYAVAYAADGRHLVTLNGNGTLYVLRLAKPALGPPGK